MKQLGEGTVEKKKQFAKLVLNTELCFYDAAMIQEKFPQAVHFRGYPSVHGNPGFVVGWTDDATVG